MGRRFVRPASYICFMNTWPRDNHTGPRGGLSTGPGGGASTGPGGGASTGPGGGMSTGPGGGLYTGSSKNPYRSNWPPATKLFKYLRASGRGQIADLLEQRGWK